MLHHLPHIYLNVKSLSGVISVLLSSTFTLYFNFCFFATNAQFRFYSEDVQKLLDVFMTFQPKHLPTQQILNLINSLSIAYYFGTQKMVWIWITT